MREILFRGKVVNSTYPEINGDWAEGYYYKDLQNGQLESFIFRCPIPFQVDPHTVGQFTNLYDQYEKKIFEGDIVKTLDGIATVVFDSGMAMFGLESPGSEAVDYDLFLVAPASVIIGNVFDNPELIE